MGPPASMGRRPAGALCPPKWCQGWGRIGAVHAGILVQLVPPLRLCGVVAVVAAAGLRTPVGRQVAWRYLS